MRRKVVSSLLALTLAAALGATAAQLDELPSPFVLVVLTLASTRTSIFVMHDTGGEAIRHFLVKRIGNWFFPPPEDVPAVFATEANPIGELVGCEYCLPFWSALAWVAFWVWLPTLAVGAGMVWAVAMLSTWGIRFIDQRGQA